MKYLVMFVLLFLLSCKNDDDSSGLNTLDIAYEQNLIEISFLEEGETAAPLVNWSGEKGMFSATTLPSSEEVDLVGNSIFIDPETGVLSWNNFLPLGESNIFITASNEFGTGMVTITINNVFKGRSSFFTGGFNNDISDEPFLSNIDDNVLFKLRDDGVVTLLSIFDSTVIGGGNWKAEGDNIKVTYTHIDYPGENLVMIGLLTARINGDPTIMFAGLWGKGLDQDNNIEELMGAFSFSDTL